MSPRARWLTSLALAVGIGMLSMRGAFESDVVHTDAARHAMNGALIHDWVRSGRIMEPVEYAKAYYARMPAVSIPYHPPMFPLIEAFLYGVFGVNVVVARVAVAICVSVCALLIMRIIVGQYDNLALAIVTIITFFSLGDSLIVSSDVMLEFPALAFAVAALTFVRLDDGNWRLRDGLLFAALGGLAVWTKQHAVFVGLVPTIYLVLTRHWTLLLGKTYWISMSLFSALVYALLKTIPAGGGVGGTSQVLGSSLYATLSRTLEFYPRAYFEMLGIIPGAVCALAFIVLLVKRLSTRQPSHSDLMLSWALAVIGMVLILKQFSSRYIIYALPPMICLGYYGVLEFCRRETSQRAAQGVLLGCFALVAIGNFQQINDLRITLRGPGDVAKYVVGQNAERVLYCGNFDGSFIFAMRSLCEPMQCWVLVGDKLAEEAFEPESFKDLIDRYGIEYVAIERTALDEPWDEASFESIPTLKLEKEFELKKTRSKKLSGRLFVYRNSSPSPEPADPTQFQVNTIGSWLGRYNNLSGVIETLGETPIDSDLSSERDD